MSFKPYRAVRANRRHLPRWRASLGQVFSTLGFGDRCPNEYQFAEAVYRWQRGQRPPLIADGILGPQTWGQMSRPRAAGQPAVRPLAAPQTFAASAPGTIPIDADLLERNRMIERTLLADADRYFAAGDFRWFFTHAHGQITKQINANLARFDEPNDLMVLNIHFAEEFLRALNGQGHDAWRRAFAVCQALERNAEINPLLVGEIEVCGAAMANVHIGVDLTRALSEVGCITPRDYGNMLVFVNRGALAAQVRLRGRLVGATEAILTHFVAPLLDMELKAWRNAAYQRVCNTPVPDPTLSL